MNPRESRYFVLVIGLTSHYGRAWYAIHYQRGCLMTRASRQSVLHRAVNDVVLPGSRKKARSRSRSVTVEMLERRQLLSVPAAPTSLSVGGYYPGALQSTWTDNATDEQTFAVEAATDPGFTYDFTSLSLDGNGAGTGNVLDHYRRAGIRSIVLRPGPSNQRGWAFSL